MRYSQLRGETFDEWLARIQPLRRRELKAQLSVMGSRAVESEEVKDLPSPFESDEEIDEFIAWVREERRTCACRRHRCPEETN